MIVFIAALLIGTVLIGPPVSHAQSAPALQVKQMAINGTSLAYVEDGAGETIVFVHGVGGDWRTWDGVRPAIVASKFRYVALSLRHHYPNAWLDEGKSYTFTQHMDDLAAFIRALNVGKVYLVGNSFSGRLVGNAVLRHPDLIRGAVLGEPSLAGPTSPEGKAALAAFQQDLAKSSAAAKAGDARLSAITMFDAVNTPNTFDKISAERRQNWLDNERSVPLVFSGGAAPQITCAQLAEIKVPVIVVGGAWTRDSYKAGNQALVNCLPPGTEAMSIPNAHHMWPTENPEAAAQVVISFFSKLR